MKRDGTTLLEVSTKTAVAHTVTYFLAGVVAFFWFDYARMFADTDLRFLMRPVDDPMVAAGPLFQPIRGALFGLLFYLLRDSWLGASRGWLVLWMLLVVVGVIGAFAPAPGSLEGMIYTKIPLGIQLRGLPEVIVQPLLLSLILWLWVPDPKRRWLDWSLGIAFTLVLLMSVLGMMAGRLHVTAANVPGAANANLGNEK
jgi:hypothetical protein